MKKINWEKLIQGIFAWILMCIIIYIITVSIRNESVEDRLLILENKVIELQYKNIELNKKIELKKLPYWNIGGEDGE